MSDVLQQRIWRIVLPKIEGFPGHMQTDAAGTIVYMVDDHPFEDDCAKCIYDMVIDPETYKTWAVIYMRQYRGGLFCILARDNLALLIHY
jgi:3,4-dihydroxy-2-butanone 4-phosphate synthase